MDETECEEETEEVEDTVEVEHSLTERRLDMGWWFMARAAA